MPKNKSAAVRYHAIDKRIRRKFKPYPSMQELIEAVEEVTDSSISESSIEKDLRAMRTDSRLGYFAPIKFSKTHGGYFYEDPEYSIDKFNVNEDDISAIQMAIGILQQFRNTDFFKDFEGLVDKMMVRTETFNNSEIRDRIQLEKAPSYSGQAMIAPLIEFIRNKDVVEFTYTKFSDAKSVVHSVHPYVLREYRNRWYLTGFDDASKQVKTFGLERMKDLKASEIKYYADPDFDPHTFFSNTLGITTMHGMEPSEVILSFSRTVSEFIRTMPWHESQKELADTPKEYRISLKLTPSMELVRQILSYGNEVKVIEPKSLKAEVEKRK